MNPLKKKPLSAAVLLLTTAYSFRHFIATEPVHRALKNQNDTVLYDLSCPLALDTYIGAGNPEEATHYSIHSGAQAFVKQALNVNALTDSKILFIGDSNMRQVFSSFSCLAHTAGFWKDDNAYTSANAHGNYYDGRLKLKEGFGEIFYLPTAGKIQDYGWYGKIQGEKIGPIHGKEDWLESCRERKPFAVDSYTYDAANKRVDYSADDDRFETVILGGKDVVFFNAGLHPSTRMGNMARLTELLDCMEDAKAKKEDADWPQLFYVRSNQQHFPGHEGGLYDHSKPPSKVCSKTVDSSKNPHLEEDKTAFSGKLPMIGFNLDLDGVGNLHIQKDGHDCSHWTQPGVPDVYSKEIAIAMLTIK